MIYGLGEEVTPFDPDPFKDLPYLTSGMTMDEYPVSGLAYDEAWRVVVMGRATGFPTVRGYLLRSGELVYDLRSDQEFTNQKKGGQYMASSYQADRWRDRSIVAQNAANVTASIIAALVAGGMDINDVTEERIEGIQRAIFRTTIDLAGEDAFERAATAAAYEGGGATTSERPSGGYPYENTEVKFGKFKGMTIGEIDHATDSAGKSGHGWLKWLQKETDNEFMKKALDGYFSAKEGR